jgi:hypothetical protein
MTWGDIPEAARTRLASERVRMYHALWHFVRNKEAWNSLEASEKDELVRQGWTAPRFEDQPGAGIDFLYMHRRMIQMVNLWASGQDHHDHHGAAPQAAVFVQAWRDIPWDHTDPVWPMPRVDPESVPEFQRIFGRSKEQGTTEFYRRRVRDVYENRDWLRAQSLDQLGTELEFRIHGWLHMHWSSAPPADPNSLDESNEWLGSPFSSHVNRHFWKLHGWIEDRIHAWEDARGEEADLTEGWDGPPDSLTGEPHSADPQLFRVLRFDERAPLLMPWKDLLLERERAEA